MASLLGLGLLAVVLAGYALWFRRKLQLDVHLIPITIICTIVLLLYLAGLFGLLLPASIAICIGGVVFLVWMLLDSIKHKEIKQDITAFITPGLFLFFALAGLFFLLSRGVQHTLGDVLGHWGLLSKYLHLYNQLPNNEINIITFQSYPPGSALFQYFIAKVTGYSEGHVIWANILFTLAGYCSVFAVLKRKTGWWGVVVLGAGVTLIFAMNYNVYDIIVDMLLPAVGFAGTAGILQHRGTAVRCTAVVCPSMVACVLIKNSGLYFVVINAVLLLVFTLREGKVNTGAKARLARFLPLAAAILLPLLCLFFWNAYVDRAYDNGATSDHAMRAENIVQGYGDKTPEDKAEISALFVKRTVSIQENRFTLYMLLWNAAFAMGIFCCWRKNRKQALYLLKWLLFADAATVLYLLGLLAMYLTTMSLPEAYELASFDRYYASIVAWTSLLLLWVLQQQVAVVTHRALKWALGTLAAVPVLFGIWKFNATLCNNLLPPPYAGTFYEMLDTQIPSLGPGMPGALFLVIGPETIEARTSISALLRYKLFSSGVSLVHDVEDNRALFDEMMGFYHFLLILEDSPHTRAFMDAYPRFAQDDSHIGLYPLPL